MNSHINTKYTIKLFEYVSNKAHPYEGAWCFPR